MDQVTISRELLRQILDYVEEGNPGHIADRINVLVKLRNALSEAKEQPAVEPEEDGWRLRNVYFKDGEPMMHTAPQAQPAPVQEPVMDRESSWFALVMTAAAELEDASNCLRDPDAKRTATRGAEYFRNAAKVMSTAQQPRKAVKLTDEEIEDACWTEVDRRLMSFAHAIEQAVLKKNGVEQ